MVLVVPRRKESSDMRETNKEKGYKAILDCKVQEEVGL